MSKTIEIKKVHIRNLFLSIIVGFGVLFILEHFGQFSYIAENNNPIRYDNEKPRFSEFISNDTNVRNIYFTTFFGDQVITAGNGFLVKDIGYSDGEFYTYSNKIYYIVEAVKTDLKYGFYFSLGLFLLTLLFSIFKFKLI